MPVKVNLQQLQRMPLQNADVPEVQMSSKEITNDTSGPVTLASNDPSSSSSPSPSASASALEVGALKLMNQALASKEFKKLLEEPNKACIFKIPRDFRTVCVYDNAYTPCRVAIGPYHAKDSGLMPMAQYKLKYLKMLRSKRRNYENEFQHVADDYISKLLFCEENVRQVHKYYSEIGDLESLDSFSEMILTDGAFIVAFLCDIVGLPKGFRQQNIGLTARESKEILRDLLLLENQLPFFFQVQLFRFFFPDSEWCFSYIAYRALRVLVPVERDTMLDHSYFTFDTTPIKCLEHGADLNDIETFKIAWTESTNGIQVKHLLHLMMICCPPFQKSKSEDSKTHEPLDPPVYSQPFNSVTELHEAGVQFKKINYEIDKLWLDSPRPASAGEQKELLVKFNNGVLQMPRLTLDEFSESFFRNMVAFEQYYLDTFNMSSYLHFMDHLIDTENDVRILQERNLIENWLESKENVTSLFNSISKHAISYFDGHLHVVSKDMKKYVRMTRNKWKAKLRRDYFGTPWAPISFIAALVLLILTIIQTLSSLRQVNWI